MGAVCPLLIQNAKEDPQYESHPAIRANLIRYLGVPICNPKGESIGTLCILDDKIDELLGEEDVRFMSLLGMRVSAEVERERMVQERLEEQRAIAAQMTELNTRLQDTLEEKRRFAAMVLHDLRHPLTTVKTLLYLLREEEDPQERTSYIGVMENRVQALASLLDALLQVCEIESGHLALHLERVVLGEVITHCLKSFAPVFVSEAVRFECEVAKDLGIGHTDSSKLTHILLNLLSNALKFTPEGTIRVRARRKGTRFWTLEVEDTGLGMSEQDKERVFEEFYRGSGTPAKEGQGVGLGLAIVKQLCSVMEATIAVESTLGVGTCFRITFPRNLDSNPA